MFFFSYWEIFGIVLVTLYFVLSIIFPKAENSSKGQKNTNQDDNKDTAVPSNLQYSENISENASFTSEEQITEEKNDVVYATVNAQRELLTRQEVKTVHNLNHDSPPSKLHETIGFSDNNTDFVPIQASASVKDELTEPSQPYLTSVTPTNAKKLSELEDNSVSTSKDPQEFLQDNGDSGLHVAQSGKNEPKVFEAGSVDECPSKYLHKEFKNEGLDPSTVSVRRVSDSTTDRTHEDVDCSEIHPSNTENLHSELPDLNEVVKMNSTDEMPFHNSQNNNNLEKFADGLATSAIETGVDNSVCLNNFAENLSEKIFWASAEDVISEVNANIQNQKEIKLEPVKLESLSNNVASEVVNEAIGEAAIKEEYQSEDDLEETSPNKIQPHLGYVVENVVNNAICEAALKIKNEEDEYLEVTGEREYHLDVLDESESPKESAHPPDTNAKTISINDDLIHPEQAFTEPQQCSNNVQDSKTVDNDEQLENQELQSKIDEVPTDVAQGFTLEASYKENYFEEKPFTTPEHDLFPSHQTENQFDELKDQQDQSKIIESVIEECPGTEDTDTQHIDQSSVAQEGKYQNNDPITLVSLETKQTNDDGKVNSESTLNDESDQFSIVEQDQLHIGSHNHEIDKAGHLSELVDKEVPDIVGDVDESKVELGEQAECNITEIEFKTAASIVVEDFNKGETNADDVSQKLDVNTIQQNQQGENEKPETEKLDEPAKSGDKESFWRQSLILDLEEDFELEESFSSDATSPVSPQAVQQNISSEGSQDLSDSEEDEIIDHDADANLGAVGGSYSINQNVSEEDFDFDDYGSDEEDLDEDNAFEPVLTVDGLCISKQTEKRSKQRGNLKSVGSHYNHAIVLDNGCGRIKLGYAGDRIPRVDQQTVFGIPSRFSMQITGLGTNLRDFKKFGSEAVSKAGVMHLNHPMKAGMIDNWTDVEDIWEHMIYSELGAEVGDNPIIMTEISQNSKKNREKITEILFEHLNVPAMYLADQLPLSIYASGLTSGVCLSSGYSCSQAAVVYEGHTLSYTVQHLDIGGGHLTENLKLLLRDNRGHNFTTSSGLQIVKDIKENIAFVAKDYNSEIHKYKTNDTLTKYYTLPDGQVIDIGYECMSCVEPLFQPEELMLADATTASQSPIHKMVNNAIMRCDTELQQMCHNNIILSGGTTLLKGFTSRLQNELHHINHRIRKIRTPEHRHYSPWIGGSILGSLSVFEDQYITMDEYGDSGPRVVHRKCF